MDEHLSPPRLREADRDLLLEEVPLDELLPDDHLARLLWNALEGLDLAEFYSLIQARGPVPGRPAIDPRILLCLWLYATCEAVTSGRKLARLCREHLAYLWILGGVTVEAGTLNDFRKRHGKEFERLHTQLVGVLLEQGLVELQRVAQDGIRVRASAGAASFRRQETLEFCLAAAEQQLEAVKQAAKERPKRRNKRRQAAQERASRERQARIEAALKQLPEIRAAKKRKDREKARASSTDPDARVMKMPDGGFRPAYNVQLAVDTESRVVVGVDVSNSGGDMGKAAPMLEEVERKTGRRPKEYLVDGGFAKHADIEEAAAKGVTLYAPVAKPKDDDEDPHEPKARDGPGTMEWRQRMATAAAKETYRLRAATVETTNGDLRAHRGWQQIPLRGLAGAKAFVLLGAVAHTILRALKLGAQFV